MDFVDELIDRIARNGEQGIAISTGTCPKISDCNYVVEQVEKGNLKRSQMSGYVGLVCEKYHGECELNKLKVVQNGS
jgi:hypothetical protein